MATVIGIYLRPSAGTPVRQVRRARAAAGRGLEGDHGGGSRRQITLLGIEGWRAACAEIGVDLDPGHRRANVVVEGLDLEPLVGQQLRLGGSVIEVQGRLAPCRLIESGAPGLEAALAPGYRGGAYCTVVGDGEVTVGDPVTPVKSPGALSP